MALALAALILLAPSGRAQTAGQAEVAFQGYYLSNSGQPLIDTSGMAFNFKEFFPSVGLIHGAFEGYGGAGFHMGTSFVGLEQAPILGWHWDIIGGDFQFTSSLIRNPFTNIYTPDIAGRGVRIAMKRKNRGYQFFFGQETVLGGPRIPYRLTLPQQIMGVTLEQKVGERWQFGVRFLNTSTNPDALIGQQNFFLPGHEFQGSDSLTFQTSYDFTKHVKFYGEASYSAAQNFAPSTPSTFPILAPANQAPFSLVAGATWETDQFSLRGNFVRQGVTYLPLLGYFVGDRQGPFVEGRYRFNPKLDVYGSASAYSNNLENNAEVPTFHSSALTAGASFALPWKFSASASISTLHLTTRDPAQPNLGPSDNRQLNFSLSRPIKRHNLRFSLIDMNLNYNFQPQMQRYTEVADDFTWKHLALGGAIRVQNSHTTESRNTFFYRGSIQANFRRFSAYAYAEKGNDLANRTIFSTNAYSSTVVGMSAPMGKGWNLQLEAFRNRLNTALNAENIFLFPNAGLNQTQLVALNQWSVYFRIGKQFHWGTELPVGSGGIEQYAMQHAPLVGNVQGMVMEQSLSGPRPAANVAVILDHGRTAATDSTGRYNLADVPEGSHEVGLDMEQLPADYEPGPAPNTRVSVGPRSIVRADFIVIRLTFLDGRIEAVPGVSLDNIVIRLAGTDRYTTPDADGNFAFYNLREGEYLVAIDEQTLPEEVLLDSAPNVQVVASSANPPGPVTFVLKMKPEEEKPIHRMFQDQIRMPAPTGAPGNPGGNDKPSGGSGGRSRGGAGGRRGGARQDR